MAIFCLWIWKYINLWYWNSLGPKIFTKKIKEIYTFLLVICCWKLVNKWYKSVNLIDYLRAILLKVFNYSNWPQNIQKKLFFQKFEFFLWSNIFYRKKVGLYYVHCFLCHYLAYYFPINIIFWVWNDPKRTHWHVFTLRYDFNPQALKQFAI